MGGMDKLPRNLPRHPVLKSIFWLAQSFQNKYWPWITQIQQNEHQFFTYPKLAKWLLVLICSKAAKLAIQKILLSRSHTKSSHLASSYQRTRHHKSEKQFLKNLFVQDKENAKSPTKQIKLIAEIRGIKVY